MDVIIFNYPTGRFLLGVLSDLHKWHSEEPTYIQDNRSKAGGKTILHTGFQSQYRLPMHSENHLKHPAFQKVVRKWHKKIALVCTFSFLLWQTDTDFDIGFRRLYSDRRVYARL